MSNHIYTATLYHVSFFCTCWVHEPTCLIFTGVPVVSLESAERPNYFLVVSGRSRLQLEQWSRGPEFNRRATFIQHQGLFLPGHTSFELVGQPGTFLILTRTAARAQRYDTSEGFKASSSFTLEGQEHMHIPNTNKHILSTITQKLTNYVFSLSSGREQFCDTLSYDV